MPRVSKPTVARRDSSPIDAADKRRRKPLSCMECRRLKLRCDRQFPCESCQKRGCASICPHGSLTGGKGSRFILANTEELHDKINALIARVRTLEKAVEELHGVQSEEPHPLLSKELLLIKMPLEIHRPYRDANGNIAMTTGGLCRPPKAEPELLTMPSSPSSLDRQSEEYESNTSPDDFHSDQSYAPVDHLPTTLVQITSSFPYSADRLEAMMDRPMPPPSQDSSVLTSRSGSPSSYSSLPLQLPSVPAVPRANSSSDIHFRNGLGASASPQDSIAASSHDLGSILKYLPDASTALNLCDIFFKKFSWLCCPISREDVDAMLADLYLGAQTVQDSLSSLTKPTIAKEQVIIQRCSILYAIFASAVLLDDQRSPCSDDAKTYHTLSGAALNIACAVNECCILNCISLVLSICYLQLSNEPTAQSDISTIINILVKQVDELANDPAHSPVADAQHESRRRKLFQAICMVDAWQAFSAGRPSSFTGSSIAGQHLESAPPQYGARHPRPSPPLCDDQDDFQAWRFRFAFGLLSEVVHVAFTSGKPDFPACLDLDLKICEAKAPAPPPSASSTAAVMQPFAADLAKQSALLHLHRRWFVVALTENPQDPFQSKYSASVIATFKCSCQIVQSIGLVSDQEPLVTRMPFFWADLYPACIVLSLIVARAPSSDLAGPALAHLDAAAGLLQRLSQALRQPWLVAAVIDLHAKAAALHNAVRSNMPHVMSPSDEELLDQDGLLQVLARRRISMPKSVPMHSCSDVRRRSSTLVQPLPPLAPVQHSYSMYSQPLSSSDTPVSASLGMSNFSFASGQSPLETAQLPRTVYTPYQVPEIPPRAFSSGSSYALSLDYGEQPHSAFADAEFTLSPECTAARPTLVGPGSYMSELGGWDSAA